MVISKYIRHFIELTDASIVDLEGILPICFEFNLSKSCSSQKLPLVRIDSSLLLEEHQTGMAEGPGSTPT